MTPGSPRTSRFALSLGLCVLLVAVSGLAATGAVAAVQEDVDVAVGSTTGTPGSNVTVDVTVRAANVSGYELSLLYDPDVVSVASVQGADFSDPVTNVNREAGRLNATQVSVDSVDDPTLARITFELVGEPTNESALRFDEAGTELFDENSESIFVDSYSEGLVRVNSTGTPTPVTPTTDGSGDGRNTPSDTPTATHVDTPSPTASGGTTFGVSLDGSFLLGAGFVLLVFVVGGIGYYLGGRSSGNAGNDW